MNTENPDKFEPKRTTIQLKPIEGSFDEWVEKVNIDTEQIHATLSKKIGDGPRFGPGKVRIAQR